MIVSKAKSQNPHLISWSPSRNFLRRPSSKVNQPKFENMYVGLWGWTCILCIADPKNIQGKDGRSRLHCMNTAHQYHDYSYQETFSLPMASSNPSLFCHSLRNISDMQQILSCIPHLMRGIRQKVCMQ